jgi:hypothetical protein
LANNNTTTPTGNLLDLQNKGTSELSVDVSGNLTTIGNIQGTNITSTGTINLGTLGTTDTSTALCRNTSNIISACSTTGAGAAFVQGGNTFAATATLGTNDSNSLAFETNNVTQATIAVGGAALFKNSTDSSTGFQIQNSGGTALLAADTTNLQLNTGNLQSTGTLAVQGPDGGSILIGAVANSGTGTNAMTFSGNEITDKTRATDTQGDGRQPPDSSTGIWEGTTNMIANGGAESFASSNTTAGGTGTITITRSTGTSKFGAASFKIVTDGTGANQGIFWSNGTRITVSGSTTYTFSVWAKGAVGGEATRVLINWYDSGGTFLAQTSNHITLTTSWQQYTVTGTSPSTAASAWPNFGASGTLAYTAWLDGAQFEQKPIATPYVETNGGTASRAAARVRAPSSSLNATQGWFATRFRMGFASTSTTALAAAAGESLRLAAWQDDANNRVVLTLNGSNQLALTRTSGGGGGGAVSTAQTFNAGGMMTVVGKWDSGNVYISVNGGAFVSAANTNIPTLAATTFDIGSDSGSLAFVDSDNMWTAAGTGTLSDADAAALNRLGNSDPSLAGINTIDSAATPTFAWNAESTAYTGTNNTATLQSGITLDDTSLYHSGNGAIAIQGNVNSTTAFQVQNAAGTSDLTVDTTNGQVAVGPAAVPANGVLTIGTNTTAATGGLYFGTDTNLYRSAASILKTDSKFLGMNTDTSAAGGSIQGIESFLTASPSSALGVATDYLGSLNIATSSSANTAASTRLFGSSSSASYTGAGGGTLGTLVGARGRATNTSNGTITTAASLDSFLDNTGTGTIQNAYGLLVEAAINSGGGTITSAFGAKIISPTVGSTNSIGLQITAPSGATNNYALQLSDTGGTAAGGIEFGTDTNIHRSAAGSLTVHGTVNSTTAFQVQDASSTNLFSVDTTNQNITIGVTGSSTPVGMSVPGTGTADASTPDSAATSVTGGLDLIAKIQPQDWTPSASQTIISKYAATNSQYSYNFSIGNTTGRWVLALSNSGTAATAATASVGPGYVNGTAHWVRATWRASDGRVQFFKSEDGVTWTQVGTDQTISIVTVPSIFDGTANLTVGAAATANNTVQFNGTIYRAQVYSGFSDAGGTLKADFNPADAASLTSTSWVSSTTGETWTVNGTARLNSLTNTVFTPTLDTVATAALFRNASDSTTAFQIQNASGTAVLTADTVNNLVTVGNNLAVTGTSALTGNVGIGTAPGANTQLTLSSSYTGGNATYNGISNTTALNLTSDLTNGIYIGAKINLTVSGTGNQTGTSSGRILGVDSLVIFNSSGTAVNIDAGEFVTVQGSSGGGITNTARGLYSRVDNQSTNAIVTAYGLDIASNNGAGPITNNVGLHVAAMSGTSTAYGIQVAAPITATTKAAINLSDTGGTSAGGLLFGTDATLYRSAASTLTAGSALIVAPTSNPTLSFQVSPTISTASANATLIWATGSFTGAGINPFGAFISPTFAPSASITSTNALRGSGTANPGTGVTISNYTAVSALPQTGSDLGAVTNLFGFQAIAPTYGTILPTNADGMQIGNYGATGVGTAIGLKVAAQSGATTNIGVKIDKADTYSLQLSDTGGTSAGGIEFGTDTNLYRSAAGVLQTDGQLSVGKASTTVGQINFFGSGTANSIALKGPTSPSAGLTVTLPNETGTICTTGSICAGYAASTGSGSYIQNGTSLQSSANFNFQSAALGSVGGVIEGASSQSADLFQLKNSGATVLSHFDSAGKLALGTASAPGNLLSVGALTVAAGTYQIAVSTGAVGNSGIVVQTVAAQSSGNILQAQDSTGAALATIDYLGNLTVKAATVNGSLTVNGHIITGGTALASPGSINAHAGVGASCTVVGNDTGGQITLNTGTSGWANGAQCTYSFVSAYGVAPHPVITSANSADTSAVKPWVSATINNFTVNFISPDTGANTYVWNYFIAQ